MRWNIAPNDRLTDKDLEDEWISFFNLTERKLLEMLIARKEKKIQLIEANINGIKSKLGSLIASGEYKDELKQLQDFVDKLDKDTQKKKRKNLSETPMIINLTKFTNGRRS